MNSLKALLLVPAGLLVFSAGFIAGTRQPSVHADSGRVFELRTYHCAPG